MRFSAKGLTDIGKIRGENQDAFLIDEEAGLFAVADGMGGMLNGALAARLTLECLQRLLKAGLLKESAVSEADENEKDVMHLLKEVIIKLSDLVRSEVGPRSGSTLVMALAKKDRVYIAHLGDSRAYLLRGGRLERLTRDHNMAADLVDEGKIAPMEAMHHPIRNIVTGYIGMKDVAPEVRGIYPEDGDRLLLCSDGLSSMVPDDEIARTLKEIKDIRMALKELILRANESGGEDNITAVIIDIF